MLFGFCRSLSTALLVRGMFQGMLNGWIGLMALLSAEVAGHEHQASIMGTVFRPLLLSSSLTIDVISHFAPHPNALTDHGYQE